MFISRFASQAKESKISKLLFFFSRKFESLLDRGRKPLPRIRPRQRRGNIEVANTGY